MGLRSKVGWLLHGHDNTMRTLDALSSDVRDLQRRFDALVCSVEDLARSVEVDSLELREQQLAEFDSVREAVISATDDLSGRIAALHRSAGEPT